ncbi:MAG: energy transducer TonB [Oligoflexia bacterium]|nr:energy transducer TonB [Oligoflexia bacterium]MBF0364359.1 energy transducer TonB [Oligoflexia bacterium]
MEKRTRYPQAPKAKDSQSMTSGRGNNFSQEQQADPTSKDRSWETAITVALIAHCLLFFIKIAFTPHTPPPEKKEFKIAFVEHKPMTKPRAKPIPVPPPPPKVEQQVVKAEEKVVEAKTPQKKVAEVVKAKAVVAAAPAKAAMAKAASPTPRKVTAPVVTTTTNNAPAKVAETYKADMFKGMIKSIVNNGTTSMPKVQPAGGVSSDNFVAAGGGLAHGGTNGAIKKASYSSLGSANGADFPSASKGSLDTNGRLGADGNGDKKSFYTIGAPADTVVVGSIDRSIINKILREHIKQFQHCYQSQLDSSRQGIDGTITLSFSINGRGSVADNNVEGENKFNNIKPCIANVLQGIKFPEPKGGGKVEVKQPLHFYPTFVSSN